MELKSSYPDVPVPKQSYTSYILEHFDSYGDSVAWIDDDRNGKVYTFAKVRKSILKCADSFFKDGLRAGHVVGVMCVNTPEQRIAVLAALHCGAVVYPCNQLYTTDELNRQFSIKKPDVIIVDSQFLPKIYDVKGEVPDNKIYVIGESKMHKTYSQLVAAGSIADSANILRNDDDTIIFLLQSSGTTGIPKVVQINTFALLASLALVQVVTPWYNKYEVLYTVAPMFHLGAIFSTHCALRSGTTHVMSSNPTADTLLQAVQEYKVTRVGALPPVLLEIVNSDIIKNYDVSSLKSVTTGGAPSSEEFKAKLMNKLGISHIAEGYGQTEAVILSNTIAGRSAKGSQGFIPPNTRLKVVDSMTGNDVGAGVYGELRFKGPQVISGGYVGNDDATKALLDDNGWLRTGDLGCYDNDGNIYVTGRIKDVIKYKGVQVAPAEIERELHKHPDIADVSVFGVPDVDGYGGEVPKAVIVARKGATLSEDDVKVFLKGCWIIVFHKREITHHDITDKLADYKQLRGGVQFMTSLPKTPTGKIQKQKLKDLLKK